MTFDKKDSESPFLSFVAAEFRKRGTPLRKQLSNKAHAAKLVSELGLKVPQRHRTLDDITTLKESDLGARAVLKYGRGWASRGVMLLEKSRPEFYFDYMGLRELSLDELIKRQQQVATSFGHSNPCWFIEDFIEPAQEAHIPFDYKFYVFAKKEIGLVVQIDRNSSPARIALMDGNFKPLVHGTDYKISSENAQPGVAVPPQNAVAMAWWALKLALQTDSPFVSIDLYDSASGPVFGEFTFSPGGTHKRMFTFSKDQIELFDVLFAAAESESRASKGTLSKILASLEQSDISKIEVMPLAQHKILSGVTYNLGSRGALRQSEFFAAMIKKTTWDVQKKASLLLRDAWSEVRAQLKGISNSNQVRTFDR